MKKIVGKIYEFLWERLPRKEQIIRWGLVLGSLWFAATYGSWYVIDLRDTSWLLGFATGVGVTLCLGGAWLWSVREKVRNLLEQEVVMTLARGLEELSYRRGDRNLRSLVNHTTAVFKAMAPYFTPVKFLTQPRLYVIEILERVKQVSLTDVVVRKDELLVGLAPEKTEEMGQ